MDCVEKTRNWIIKHRLALSDKRLLVAVSGGPDSMAMLVILEELSGEMGFTLAAANFDHGIRAEAKREKRLVTSFCDKLGIPVYTGSGDVPAEALRSGKGIEETARAMRYRFLEEIAAEWHATAIALGHNRDDQAETVLHHIIRGSGWRGLTGMPVKRGVFIRPVLDCTRVELKTFLRERRIRYAVDKSNKDNSILRNRIRNKLLPYLKRNFNPSIDDALIRIQENLHEGWQALSGQGMEIIPVSECDGEIAFSVQEAEKLSDYRIYLLIDTILRDRFGIIQDIEKTHFDAAKKLIRKSLSGNRIQFPHGVVLRKEHGTLTMAFEERSKRKTVHRKITIQEHGKLFLRSWNLSVSIREVDLPEKDEKSKAGEKCFANIEFPIHVRGRRPGDRLIPFGMKGRKKLSDIFIDRKIPLSSRDRVPVFEDAHGIFWVPGVVTAERMRINADTKKIIYISLSRGGENVLVSP